MSCEACKQGLGHKGGVGRGYVGGKATFTSQACTVGYMHKVMPLTHPSKSCTPHCLFCPCPFSTGSDPSPPATACIVRGSFVVDNGMVHHVSAAAYAAAADVRMPLLYQSYLQAADYAEECAQISGLSAAVLFPCSADAADADAATAGSSGSSGSSAALGGEAAATAPNPLFNTHALQLWILRGCQQLKGGLRDKPGKSADYYHTCYCLSGLSAAQHMAGGSVIGPVTPAAVSAAVAAASGAARGGSGGGSDAQGGGVQHINTLAAADPLLNIVVGKVAEAKAFFSQAGGVE